MSKEYGDWVREMSKKPHPQGVYGLCGPNDGMYINGRIRKAAEELVAATGFYAHGYSRDIPLDHPICRALEELARVDKETCNSANDFHRPELFKPYTSKQASNIKRKTRKKHAALS